MDEFLERLGVGRRSPHDIFFDDTYKTCKIFIRKGVTIVDDEELCHEAMKEFPCNVPGCSATFNTLIDFEIHYNGSHRYICLECKKSRPSSKLLDIHIQETHDSFFKVLAERQPMYQCYVAECDQKFQTPTERREHCITVHKYPRNFRFEEGARSCRDRGEPGNQMEVDKETQLTKPKRSPLRLNKNQRTRTFCPTDKKTGAKNFVSTVVASSLENPEPPNRASSLSFIPRQVSASYSKLLTKNQNLEKDVLNNGCMMDLAESLPT